MSLKTGGRFHRRTDFKLTLWFIFTFLISSLIICGFLYLRLKHQLVKEVDRFILDETGEVAAVLSRNPNEVDYLMKFEDETMGRKYYPFFFRILDHDGKPLYVSKEFQKIGYNPNETVLANARNGKETREEARLSGRRTPYLVISTPFFNEGRLTHIIQLGTHLRFVRKSLTHFKYNLLAALPIVLILGSLGGWILARKSLSPIGYIASKARSITSESLGERLTGRGTGDEMDDLIETINGMIARLEGSFRRMAEFTADASHELKTPLCAMRGEAEVLLSKRRGVEEYEETLAGFIGQFDRVNQMLNDLILLSKSDSAQIELQMSPVRVDLLLTDLLSLFEALAEQKQIQLTLDPLREIFVMGDKMRLQQLFSNLIDNAIKYTPKGSVQVSLDKEGETAVIKVRDTGIGIPEGERERIFKRFYRVDKSRSRETGGVGLGLSIAEWIAHAHHGNIEVESELTRGSTFTVSLPLQEPVRIP
jgi:heavy metal sensor kinase